MLNAIGRITALLTLAVFFVIHPARAGAPDAELGLGAATAYLIQNGGTEAEMLQWVRSRAASYAGDQQELNAEISRLEEEAEKIGERLRAGGQSRVLWDYLSGLPQGVLVLHDFSVPAELSGKGEEAWYDLIALYSAQTYLQKLRARDMGRLDDAFFCEEARNALLAMALYFDNTVEDLAITGEITGQDMIGAVEQTMYEIGMNLHSYCLLESSRAGIVISHSSDGDTVAMEVRAEVSSPLHDRPALFNFNLSRGSVGANFDALIAEYGWRPKTTGTRTGPEPEDKIRRAD